jgi:hypothetical protein
MTMIKSEALEVNLASTYVDVTIDTRYECIPGGDVPLLRVDGGREYLPAGTEPSLSQLAVYR